MVKDGGNLRPPKRNEGMTLTQKIILAAGALAVTLGVAYLIRRWRGTKSSTADT